MDDPLAGDTSTTPPPPPAGAPQPTSTPSTGMVPGTQPTPPTYQTPPMDSGPMRRTGVLGVLDAVTDMLAGRDQQKVTYDQNGRGTQNVPLTRGQQYAKIGMEALSGAARGLAAPPGPAHAAQGAAAGIMGGINDQKDADETADSNAQRNYQAKQKAKLDELNYQLGIRTIAKNDLELKAMGVKANQDATTFSNQQIDREKQLDSYDLGMAKDAGGIADIVSKLPNWEKQLYQHEGLQPHPVYDEEGSRLGIQIFLRKPSVDNQPAPEGTKAPKWVPGSKPGEEPHTEYFTPLGPGGEPPTNGDIDKYNRAYLTDVQTYQKQKAEDDAKRATAKNENSEADDRDKELPSKIAENKANAAKATADAAKAKAETADQSTVDAIGTGKIALDRLGYLLARNPDLVTQVTAKYPDFDSSKAAAYPSVYKEFTSTKPGTAGNALNSGGTALVHLKELSEMNTVASHIPGTPSYNAYNNKVDTVAPELAKFYGDATVPAIDSIKSTLTATLPGNRQRAIETQAKSMGDKFDSYEQTWKNAAPSKAYEAPMPQVNQKAIDARAALDPAYRARLVTAAQPAPPPPQPASHAFSPTAWSRANPGGDVNAAIAAAKAQGYPVVQ